MVTRVEVKKKVETHKLAEAFPDANSWSSAMTKQTQATTVQELMIRLGAPIRNPTW